MIVFLIVIVVYQQIENYLPQPTIIAEEFTADRRARIAATDHAQRQPA